MRLNNFIRSKTIFEFVMLAPLSSVLILIGSVISGLLQSASVLALMPLMKYLDVTGEETETLFIINYFESMMTRLGLDKSIVTVLCFMVITTWSILAIGYAISAYSAIVSAKITRNLREQIIDAVMKAKWLYFVKKQTGSVVHAVITETGKTVAGYNDSIRFFSAVLQGFVLLITAFFVSPFISILSLLTGMVFILIFSPWIKYAKQVGTKTGESLKSITAKITDGLHGLKPLKAMNNDRFLIPILNSETAKLEKQQIRAFMVSNLPPVMRNSLVILFIALGTYYAVENSVTPLVSLVPMIFLFRGVVQQLGVAQGVFQSQKGMEPFYISLKKSIAEAHRMEEKWEGTLDPIFNDSIKINDMKFSYLTKSVLKNISIVIPKNSFIALMGESGGGKTTFSDLLCALYTPDSGEILVDGLNLYQLDIKKWRRMIGYVPQDLFLFHDTVLHNVNLGDTEVTEKDVVRALRDSGCWEFVSELPEGVKTVIGERGIRLSGGQRQRLSIARAIVGKPQILILDEATTALDPATEERILQTLRKLTDKGITIIAVSHQPAVLDIADEVYQLKAGKLEEIKGKKIGDIKYE